MTVIIEVGFYISNKAFHCFKPKTIYLNCVTWQFSGAMRGKTVFLAGV
jgi:hypothetical protein